MTDRQRPPGIWVLAIGAILLGALGACGGVYQLGAAALREPMLAAMRDAEQRHAAAHPEDPPNHGAELQGRALEIAAGWQIPVVAAQAGNVLVSLFLLVCAILLLRWHPAAVVATLLALGIGAIVDLTNGGLSVAVSLETTRAMAEMASEVGGSAGARGASFVTASGSVGVCFAAGWTLVKLGFYAFGALTLRRPSVRSLFS